MKKTSTVLLSVVALSLGLMFVTAGLQTSSHAQDTTGTAYICHQIKRQDTYLILPPYGKQSPIDFDRDVTVGDEVIDYTTIVPILYRVTKVHHEVYDDFTVRFLYVEEVTTTK